MMWLVLLRIANTKNNPAFKKSNKKTSKILFYPPNTGLPIFFYFCSKFFYFIKYKQKNKWKTLIL